MAAPSQHPSRSQHGTNGPSLVISLAQSHSQAPPPPPPAPVLKHRPFPELYGVKENPCQPFKCLKIKNLELGAKVMTIVELVFIFYEFILIGMHPTTVSVDLSKTRLEPSYTLYEDWLRALAPSEEVPNPYPCARKGKSRNSAACPKTITRYDEAAVWCMHMYRQGSEVNSAGVPQYTSNTRTLTILFTVARLVVVILFGLVAWHPLKIPHKVRMGFTLAFCIVNVMCPQTLTVMADGIFKLMDDKAKVIKCDQTCNILYKGFVALFWLAAHLYIAYIAWAFRVQLKRQGPPMVEALAEAKKKADEEAALAAALEQERQLKEAQEVEGTPTPFTQAEMAGAEGERKSIK